MPLDSTLADHHEEYTVEAFVRDYFATFNAKTLEANPEQSFTFPAVFINDGKVRLIPDASVKVFDYDVINATGWAYSKNNRDHGVIRRPELGCRAGGFQSAQSR